MSSDDRQREPEQDSRRPAFIGLAVVALLIVIGYFLVTALRHEGQLEDCLMAGRRNCAPVEAPAGR